LTTTATLFDDEYAYKVSRPLLYHLQYTTHAEEDVVPDQATSTLYRRLQSAFDLYAR
jgi:hypothetical protein